MADRPRPALGLSIGATNLAAVTADHAITRKPVLTLYRQRPPEVGVPSENPKLDEPGLVLTDFVDRVGDPVGIVAADGSMHRSEALVADALRALAYSATGGRPLPDSVAVSYPVHWGPAAVDALGNALSRVSEWSHREHPLSLIPDAAAALFAVRANPGIPARGTIAVCDFGGSGTSITLVDVATEYQPVAATVRDHDFSGDMIDQLLLTYVMSELPNTSSFDPASTSAIGSLTRLRGQCRVAKEQLSSSTVATLADEMPRGEIRLTRNELEDTIRGPLDGFVRLLEQTLGRNGIHASSLAGIVSVGGGASIPAVTTTLSGYFGVPVITTPRPQLTAAIGGALRAALGPAETSATVLTPAAAVAPMAQAAPAPVAQESDEPPVAPMEPALAWSDTGGSEALPAGADDPAVAGGSGFTAARPQVNFDRSAQVKPEPKPRVLPWYRLPAVIVTAIAVAVVLVGTAVAIGLTSGDDAPKRSPGTTSATSAPPAPASPASPAPTSGGGSPTTEPSPPVTQEPATTQPAPPPAPTTQAPPPATSEPPPTTTVPPPTTTVPPPPVTTAPQPPQVPNEPPSQPPIPQVPQIPQIPGVPQIPGIPGMNVPGIP